jgi:LysM repeat protein
MRWRRAAWISLGANVLLAVGCLVLALRRHSAGSADSQSGEVLNTQTGRTNFVVRKIPFTWRQIESADYPTYILNLREIGCPEQTVRDIIIADVNSLYSAKRATNLVTSDQQWWRSEPDPGVVQVAAQKSRELEDERRALLARLLGTNWEAGDLATLPRPSRPGIVLDGPLLGTLPSETKQAIEEINLRSQERLEAYLDAQRNAGRNPDPVELAKIRQQTRTELQGVLSPPQLEEFLLRYSQNANNWRAEFGELRFFSPTPDEFREIFRTTDGIDQQIQMLANSSDPSDVARRKALEEQRQYVMKTALGAERYQQYVQLHDPAYRDAVAMADQAGTPEATRAIYAVNLATAAEQARVRADTNLTVEQREIELKRIELEQLKANTEAVGQDVPPEPAAAPQPAPRKVHVIRPGDSPAVVALIYGLPVGALKAANPNVDLNRLRPGDIISLPPNAGAPFSGP